MNIKLISDEYRSYPDNQPTVNRQSKPALISYWHIFDSPKGSVFTNKYYIIYKYIIYIKHKEFYGRNKYNQRYQYN